jgi:hypothetical protein
MKKLVKQKLLLDRDVVRVLNPALVEVVGGKPPACTQDSSCDRPWTLF